ncbi:MAG: protease inhibitor I42 family protein [Methanosarcinaceae archaeon]|nr:protease inhibitor I42 family protein [Methanosarcinaceae archaeon]
MLKRPFTIQFPENPDTGFSWDIATSNGLEVMNEKYLPLEGEVDPEISGYRRWQILVVSKGSQKITGTCRKGNQVSSCFEIHINA